MKNIYSQETIPHLKSHCLNIIISMLLGALLLMSFSCQAQVSKTQNIRKAEPGSQHYYGNSGYYSEENFHLFYNR